MMVVMNRHTAIKALASLPSVGERLATRLYEELGVVSVRQLLDAAVAHRLRTLPGIGSRREQQILEAARAACPTQLADVLRCPWCYADALTVRAASAACSECERQFSVDHGVLDLEPTDTRGHTVARRISESKFYARYYEDVLRSRIASADAHRTLPDELRVALDFLQIGKATALLDVACGTGVFTRHFARELAERNHDVLIVGADISWPMLEAARTHLRADGLENSVHLVRADATRFPIADGAFDRVHCAGALHLMTDVDAVLAEFARVLEPGGVCVVGTVLTGTGVMRRAIRRIAELPTGFHRFRPDELQGRLADHGLAVFGESVRGDAITLAARRVGS